MSELDAYDAGLLGDGGGGDVDWWQDYIRAELERAHEFYQSQVDGQVLVPLEPTEAMIEAGANVVYGCTVDWCEPDGQRLAKDIYRAMIKEAGNG